MTTYDISLADLSQDISGGVAAELVLEWNQGEKSAARHAAVLAPYRVHGTVVSTDSAGLSKLAQRYALPQVMKLISEPKELIHAYGKAIGGEAIGVWAADNTQMFFADAEPADVVAQLLAVQRKIAALTVQIGAGIHVGTVYKVAGGLFGEEADRIEEVAENETAGGEVVFSDPILARLPEGVQRAARLREDLQEAGKFWSIAGYEGALAAVEGSDGDYPIPFDRSFFELIRRTSIDDLALHDFSAYQQRRAVAFVKVQTRPHVQLLDNFTEMSLIDLALRRVAARSQGDVVKSTGSLGIVLFEEDGAALSFARDLIETLRKLGFNARVGLARGEVFVFSLPGGGRDIAGNAVNIGSKLSEDAGLEGILVERSITGVPAEGEAFTLTLSRVELVGRRLTV